MNKDEEDRIDHTVTGVNATEVMDLLSELESGVCIRCSTLIERRAVDDGPPTFAVLGQVWHGKDGGLARPVMVAGMVCKWCRDSWVDWMANGRPHDGEPCADCGSWEHEGCLHSLAWVDQARQE